MSSSQSTSDVKPMTEEQRLELSKEFASWNSSIASVYVVMRRVWPQHEPVLVALIRPPEPGSFNTVEEIVVEWKRRADRFIEIDKQSVLHLPEFKNCVWFYFDHHVI